ncbi:MAG: hypothetical protein EOO03_16075 [Chitinophagaceae bacterium]|nr:MAG: hypothetical protein EOO03_16075 [Chitinophagaceae bacterium]
MKYKILLFLFFVPFWLRAQELLCERMLVKYKKELKEKLYPADRRRDSVLISKNEVELHLAEGIEGHYRIIFNDSVYYSGVIHGDPRIGFHQSIFYLKPQKVENILVLENVEKGSKAIIVVNGEYRYLSLFLRRYCTIVAQFSNVRPFKG